MCILELGQKMILSHEYMIIQLLSLQRNKSFEMFSRYLRFKCKLSCIKNVCSIWDDWRKNSITKWQVYKDYITGWLYFCFCSSWLNIFIFSILHLEMLECNCRCSTLRQSAMLVRELNWILRWIDDCVFQTKVILANPDY